MEKTVIIIPILLFYLIYGAAIAIAPKITFDIEIAVFRAIKNTVVKETRKRKVILRTGLRRVTGVLYLTISSFILLHCSFQLAFIPPAHFYCSKKWTTSNKPSAPEIHTKVEEIVSPLLAKSNHVGLVVATVVEGQQDISGFGVSDLNAMQVPDSKTIFEIGSLTKLFTGILLAHAFSENTVDLKDSLASLLTPDIKRERNAKMGITLQQLVTHTSGLPRVPHKAFTPASIFSSITGGDVYKGYSSQEMTATFENCRLKHKPGEQFLYSNLGFGLLGYALSQHAGTDYQELVKDKIVTPLGLHDTAVELDNKQKSRLATGYRYCLRLGSLNLAQQADNWNFPDGIVGAGGLKSTAEDMLIFLRANMNTIDNKLTPILLKAQTPLYTNDTYRVGMGWLQKRLPETNTDIIWHNGGTGGYASFLGFTTDTRVGVVILSNSSKNVDNIGFKILAGLLSH